MAANKAATPYAVGLEPGSTIVLKEPLADGWWKAEINGTLARVHIPRVKAMKRQKSTDDKDKSEKLLQRQTSKKDNGKIDPTITSIALPNVPTSSNSSINNLPADSIILSARNSGHASTTPIIPSVTLPSQVSPRSTLELRSIRTEDDDVNGNTVSDGEDSSRKTKRSHVSSLSDEPVSPKDRGEGDEDAKESARRKKKLGAGKKELGRSPSVSSKYSKSRAASELRDILLDVSASRADMEVVIRVVESSEVGIKCKDPRLVPTPEIRILDKMLHDPFIPMFAAEAKKKDITLRPGRPMYFSELLQPSINIGSIGADEKTALHYLDFNVFPFKDAGDENHVILLLMVMFYEFDLPRIFKIPDITLFRFLVVVSRKYRTVPFHNFFHAFNATQTMFFFLKTCQASKVLGPLEILALLISALCHDCDHPGLNNDFQRKAQTRVYHMHKKSVLENHHYLQCMSTLAHTETDILVNLTQEQEDQIYIYVRDLILATDLAVHGIILKSLTDRKKVLSKFAKAGNPAGMSDEDRKLIMVSLMKCADLSNEVRPGHLAQVWAKLVIAEFLEQSDLEAALELPITPFMDRKKIVIAKEQINFIEKLCLPLYTQLAQVFPEIDRCCTQLEENKTAWSERLRLFFTESSELSNKSIWEREQVKSKGSSSLSSTLAMRASNSQVPKSSRRPSVNIPPPPSSAPASSFNNSTNSNAPTPGPSDPKASTTKDRDTKEELTKTTSSAIPIKQSKDKEKEKDKSLSKSPSSADASANVSKAKV